MTLHTDVLIAGGGAAGLAAAVTAARQGCRVVLIEKYGFCGGGAVAGLSGTICGLYEASDTASRAVQVVHGFVDEFMRAMESRNGLTAPVKYGKTFTRVHDPLVWRDVADALLIEAGVTVIYHALVTDVIREGDRTLGAQIYTKQGKLSVFAPVTIDASGDADLAAMAGLPTFMGDNGRVQNPTMIFKLSGVDVGRFRKAYGIDTIMPACVTQMIAEANQRGYKLPRSKIWLFQTPRPAELLCNCTRITGNDGRELNVLRYEDFTEAEINGRLQLREYARFFKDYLQGCEASWVNDSAAQVGVRETRQIQGTHLLTNAAILTGEKSPQGIARSPWPIELHSGAKPRVEWLLNDFYEVPFGCFVPSEGEGLLAAGRCLCAEHEAVASARVTAQCFSYGHAIGHAAVLMAKDGLAAKKINGSDIRMLLNREEARLD
ncbi:FAD-dependent oxidoreductase [Pseudomonas agarici]|uniref:FAD-dependent oxidoreductase n=2 Tax=Pseudomonas agarici TaxID=46677 RepID=A0A0X1T8W2_PSEAA|nr:FAD-dependent oxidoreductase [Pseudomonas agarici]NWB94053.1 FAD-dependent oxidoreductase [Pseudomonas agarici]NWC11774.1 FAD-dependent oxidoreductase [Pseudomonas agarici]